MTDYDPHHIFPRMIKRLIEMVAEKDAVIAELERKQRWISVKEKMPEKDGRYLVVEKHDFKWVGVSCMRNGEFDMPILYWMDLPSAPEPTEDK